MQTKLAVITAVDTQWQRNEIWIQLSCGTMFPLNHLFKCEFLDDYTRVQEICRFMKTDDENELLHKQIRVIIEQDGKISPKLIAVGSVQQNKFVDLYGGEFPVSERKVYRRYERAKKRRAFINVLKARWNMFKEHVSL